MVNGRLVRLGNRAMRYMLAQVAFQWIALVANIALIGGIAHLFHLVIAKSLAAHHMAIGACAALVCLTIRFAVTRAAAHMSHLSARSVKDTLRRALFDKMLALGPAYAQQTSTSEAVQVAGEGVEQIETYFGLYLPQLLYALLAPLTLFAVIAPISLPVAVGLIACVPLIPLAIAAVQTIAKRLLASYWDQYAELGDSFLENLQGLTTLKVYEADTHKAEQMDAEAETFRRVTMRVLTMQLNSIIVMDLVAYGGAALGIALAVSALADGRIGLPACLAIIILSSEFFIPMRTLGSHFHTAMNGSAAADRIFAILDAPEPSPGARELPERRNRIEIQGLSFAYTPEREVLHDVALAIEPGSLVGVAGTSGSGKSTLASIISGRLTGYTGTARIGGVDVRDIERESLARHVVVVPTSGYLFSGTLRENLLMGNPHATDEQLERALAQARIDAFVRENGGLDMPITEGARNLSGGQRQRLCIARALLTSAEILIFDEASSNIDADSEAAIAEVIREIAGERTVVVVSHRLANLVHADMIYLLDGGSVAEQGTHSELVAAHGAYAAFWRAQHELERSVA
ncbi:ABC transporter ATP-binding protein/permease [Collinsella ihumii]|uniref:ABC transporter ATP-binding protein/permease n=1 Tax=Collinsella ihumii TaxID=1720204 RepID=A0AAW7K018_9ACTN|nr:ABC transporter ATP-binding protein/permease [Collinsella ihumii]MDN0070085.1 ABC transporter ATP-binding protein/permease [Collinsella ihumii]